jgi:hypothetical protein
MPSTRLNGGVEQDFRGGVRDYLNFFSHVKLFLLTEDRQDYPQEKFLDPTGLPKADGAFGLQIPLGFGDLAGF